MSTAPVPAAPVMALAIDPDPRGVPDVRHAVGRWLLRHRVERDTRRVVELLTSELLAKAIIHARATVAVRANCNQSRVRVEVAAVMSEEPVRFRFVADEAARRSNALLAAMSDSHGIEWEGAETMLWFEVDADGYGSGPGGRSGRRPG